MGALGLIAATCGACSSAKLWSTHGGHMLVTTAEYCAINQTPVGSKSVQGGVVARICYLCGAQPGCRESCFDSPQRARIRGVSWTVLYPTAGLATGRIMAEEWAVVACKAYNTWLYERFLNSSPRLRGVALLPFQNVDAAVIELRRAVKELGMLGGMLPSNGEAIQGHLGTKTYWPIYEEAEKLGCA